MQTELNLHSYNNVTEYLELRKNGRERRKPNRVPFIPIGYGTLVQRIAEDQFLFGSGEVFGNDDIIDSNLQMTDKLTNLRAEVDQGSNCNTLETDISQQLFKELQETIKNRNNNVESSSDIVCTVTEANTENIADILMTDIEYRDMVNSPDPQQNEVTDHCNRVQHSITKSVDTQSKPRKFSFRRLLNFFTPWKRNRS